jgi:hypothetical protein
MKKQNSTKNIVKGAISSDDAQVYQTIRNMDWLLNRVHNFCEQKSNWASIAGAFMVGLAINTWSDPNIQNPYDLLVRLFGLSTRPWNLLNYFAIFIVFTFTIGRIILKKYFKKRSYEVQLANLYRDRVDDNLKPFQRGRIAWGNCLTLQSCPNLHQGWLPSEIQIQHDTFKYVLPKNIDQFYKDYLLNEFYPKWQSDATRLMLAENPRAFSDLLPLRIKVKQTKWSQVLFCNARFQENRQEYIQQLLRGHINLTNTFVLHLVVATNDGYVLLTLTDPKVDFHPGKWACSIGEQLDPNDLIGSEEKFTLNWVERALLEELGVTTNGFNPDKVRFMAVFLEGDTGNCAIIAVVELNYDRDTLDAIIDKRPKKDKEFQDWDFITWDDIPKELITPQHKPNHPSTGIRMFYAGLSRFDVPELNRRLLNLTRNQDLKVKRGRFHHLT